MCSIMVLQCCRLHVRLVIVSYSAWNKGFASEDAGARLPAEQSEIIFMGTGTSEGIPRVSCLTDPVKKCPVLAVRTDLFIISSFFSLSLHLFEISALIFWRYQMISGFLRFAPKLQSWVTKTGDLIQAFLFVTLSLLEVATF